MPFLAAKRDQVVSFLGGGNGFSLGNRVSIPGRLNSTPAGVLEIGHVLSNWFRSAWAPSRAVDARSLSRVEGLESKRGLGSEARRRPRSNV